MMHFKGLPNSGSRGFKHHIPLHALLSAVLGATSQILLSFVEEILANNVLLTKIITQLAFLGQIFTFSTALALKLTKL